MACSLIPGRSGSTLSWEPTVPGKILGGIATRATPARQLLGRVSSIVLAYTRAGHQLLLLTPGQVIDLFIQGGVSYSHHWPCGGERFDGRYSPVERWRRRLRGCRFAACDLADGKLSGRLVPIMSSTGWPGLAVEGGSFRQGGVNRHSGVWVSGAGQQVDTQSQASLVQLPQPLYGD